MSVLTGALLSASFGLAVSGGGGVLPRCWLGFVWTGICVRGRARDAAYCASGFGRSLPCYTLP